MLLSKSKQPMVISTLLNINAELTEITYKMYNNLYWFTSGDCYTLIELAPPLPGELLL